MLNELTEELKQGRSLGSDALERAVLGLVEESVSVEDKVSFLLALADKGENPEEIAALAGHLRDRAVSLPVPGEAGLRPFLDVCGTGGDGLATFNISTTSAILLAAAGVSVVKHGNRAITSRSGSADVLEVLGIPVNQSPEEAGAFLARHGFVFLFAPLYHPAFRHIAPARKRCAELGRKTVFNFLGPLLNPARPDAQLIGVPRPELVEPLAHVLRGLGLSRGMVVCGEVPPESPAEPMRYMDELSVLGTSHVAEFHQDRGFHVGTLDPMVLDLPPARLEDLQGGDAEENAQITRDLLAGKDRGARRTAVLLNASAGLLLTGRVRTLSEGLTLAAEVVDSGKASEKLEELGNG